MIEEQPLSDLQIAKNALGLQPKEAASEEDETTAPASAQKPAESAAGAGGEPAAAQAAPIAGQGPKPEAAAPQEEDGSAEAAAAAEWAEPLPPAEMSRGTMAGIALSVALLVFGWVSHQPSKPHVASISQPAQAAAPAEPAAGAAEAEGKAPDSEASFSVGADGAAPAMSETETPVAYPAWTGQGPSSLREEAPPAGKNGALSANQIFYCLSEKTRLAAAKKTAGGVNVNATAAVERFNAMVNDFNDRCASFQYQASDFELAKKEADRRAPELEREGAMRIVHSGAQKNKAAEPAQDAVGQ